MTGQSQPARLRRELRMPGVIFLAFSALSPAASVYLFGAGVIHVGGTGTVLAMLLGGTIAAVTGLLFGELAAAFPDAGGVYPAFVRVLGEGMAFPYMLLMLSVAVSNMAFTMLGLADYLQVIIPGTPRLPAALACLAAASAIAVLSIRRGAQVTGIFLAIEMAGLAILTGAAFFHPWHGVQAAMLHPVVASAAGAPTLVPLHGSGFALAVATSIFTCGGATWALYFAEEMIEPEKRIGRVVTLVSPLAALAIGLPLALAVLGAPDRAAMISSDAPLATFLAQAGGPVLARLVSCGVVLAVFNAGVASNMGYARLLYATARDGMWPARVGAPLGRISPRFGSPLVATLALAGVSALAMLLSERMLLILNANENVLEYTLLGLAVIIGRRRGQTGYHYRVRPYPGIAMMALLTGPALGVADWFDPDAGRPSLYVLGGIIAFSLLYHPLVRRRRRLLAPA